MYIWYMVSERWQRGSSRDSRWWWQVGVTVEKAVRPSPIPWLPPLNAPLIWASWPKQKGFGSSTRPGGLRRGKAWQPQASMPIQKACP